MLHNKIHWGKIGIAPEDSGRGRDHKYQLNFFPAFLRKKTVLRASKKFSIAISWVVLKFQIAKKIAIENF
jgi:hypothetical protein